MKALSSSTIRNTLFFLFIFGCALGIGIWRQHHQHPEQLEYGILLPEARMLPDFHLERPHGRSFTRHMLKNRWTFLFFGYTHCPDICPATLSILNKISDKVDAKNTQFVFISADPSRDTPDLIENYLKNFNPNFIGATGDHQEVVRLAKSLNLYLSNADNEDEQWIDHSSTVLLVNPDAKLTAIFSAPITADEIVSDFYRISHI